MSIICIAAGALVLAGCSDTETVRDSDPATTAIAPDFSLKSLSGETVSLSAFRGKANVLLHFGTTWCVPCHTQVPILKALDDKYTDDELVVIAIDSGEPEAIVRSFAESYGVTYITLLDLDGAVNIAYEAALIPFNILIDKEGRIHSKPSISIPEEAIAKLLGR